MEFRVVLSYFIFNLNLVISATVFYLYELWLAERRVDRVLRLSKDVTADLKKDEAFCTPFQKTLAEEMNWNYDFAVTLFIFFSTVEMGSAGLLWNAFQRPGICQSMWNALQTVVVSSLTMMGILLLLIHNFLHPKINPLRSTEMSGATATAVVVACISWKYWLFCYVNRNLFQSLPQPQPPLPNNAYQSQSDRARARA